jgi:Zn-dependent M16 (insulinase) family peptidase
LTDVGLGDKDYEEVQKIQSAITGGISSNFVLIPDEMGGNPMIGLKVSSKSLEVNESEMQNLMVQTIKEANFRDKNRINDMLNFISSSNERSLIQNGHVLAMSNASSQINNIAATNDIAAGIKFITNTKHLANDINNNTDLERYIALLESIKGKIIESPIYTFTASSLDLKDTSIGLQQTAIDKLYKPQNYFDIQDQSIGWITGAQVCYCAEAFPTVDFFHQDAPALTVLGAVLRNGYLHSAIREKGGAYGSGAIQDSNNMIFKFFSYRDPRCTETFDDFKKSIAWSLKKITEDHLEEGILSIISTIDKPLSPYGEAMSDFTSSLDNKNLEKRIQFRTKVKECTVKDLINVSSKYLLNDSAKSLIAGENYIEEMKRLNFKILNI